MCNSSLTTLNRLIDAYVNWTLTLNQSWSGLTFFAPAASNQSNQCGATWEVLQMYVYLGNITDQAF
jgi:hypothetical protein